MLMKYQVLSVLFGRVLTLRSTQVILGTVTPGNHHALVLTTKIKSKKSTKLTSKNLNYNNKPPTYSIHIHANIIMTNKRLKHVI